MRVILVDDYQPFLALVENILRREPGIEIVGQAYNGIDGLKLAAELEPDLILTDYGMPDMDGITLARRVKAGAIPPKVIIMSHFANPAYREATVQAGADGCVDKCDINRQLIPLLASIASPA